MIGLFLGAFSGLIFIAFYVLIRYVFCDFLRWFDIMICVVVLVVSAFGGNTIEAEENRAYIAEYQAAKATIEASLENTQLSDLTRIDLLEQAIEHNTKLAGMQHKAQQWFGFNIPDEILDLQPINIGGESDA